MTRKIKHVDFLQGVGKGSYKSFDIEQPVLNTGAKIENIIFTEEKDGVLVQWTDHHTRQNAILVPWGNIKYVEFLADSLPKLAVSTVEKIISDRNKALAKS